MLSPWIADHDPSRVFLEGPDGAVTYGMLRAGAAPDRTVRRTVVRPGTDPASIVDVLTLPGGGRRVVVVDPELGPSDAARLVDAADAGASRAAATIVFTSGTSGRPKAVRLTEENWKAAVEASATHLEHTPDDVWLAVMPLHHVGGLSILYRSAFVGSSVTWMPRFDVDQVASHLRGGVTIASLVPTMLRRLLDRDTDPYPEHLRAVLVGGGPIPDGMVEEAHDRGIPALPTYGMTETCAQVATLRPGSPPRRAAHPLPGIDLRIGEDGLIQVKGAQVSPGYADEDDRRPGEWFVTSDRGELAPDGALMVLGRADDTIVTGGENVDPRRVEEVLLAHPGVAVAVVAGVEDAEWGRRVVAVYAGSAPEREVEAWARAHLARHEVPRPVRRVPSVPLRGPGKPDRHAVRHLFER